MPYRHAHLWLLAIFPLAGLAFWPGYFADLTAASGAFHLHAVTASLWVAMLTLQSWSIHSRRAELHRAAGKASLFLFPFLFAGGLLIIRSMAWKYAHADPFYGRFGPRLATVDAIAIGGLAGFYVAALRTRRQVQAHARWMLATIFFLLSPIIGRLAPLLPWLAIEGPADFPHFAVAVQIGNAVALAWPLLLAWRQPRHARPFLVAAALILAQILLFETLGRAAGWAALVGGVAQLPAAALYVAGLAAGAALVLFGWKASPPLRRPAAQPA